MATTPTLASGRTAPLSNKEVKEYVYILSNRSMPGLVKIGKTTTSPSQRMVELQTTGVPTPFELEFAAEVGDCHSCERDAHSALSQYRVSSKREFFAISVPEAVKKILPILGDYKIVSIKKSHEIEEIEADLERQAKAKEEAVKAKEAATRARVADLQGKLANARQRLVGLGPRPKNETEGLLSFLALCWLPVPIGWLVWIGALQVFWAEHEVFGIVCIFLLAAGFLANKETSESSDLHLKASAPFSALEEEISWLEKAIKDEGATPAPQATVEHKKVSEKVVISCPGCSRKIRLPANMTVDATCPHCKKFFRKKT